jgi:NADPH-dependent 2,4-dienoyl-CoA reductase/sulfur reductase-like enzyme
VTGDEIADSDALGPQHTLVVVGASLAGLRAVEAARSEGYRGRIVLVGDERRLPYDRPPLSKAFLEGATDDTTFRERATLTEDLGVDLRIGTVATGLDLDRGQVRTSDGAVGYDRLLIATGSTARLLEGRGEDRSQDGIFVLRTHDDATAIRDRVRRGSRVVVVGAGFIGSEVAASCHALGAKVDIIEASTTPLVRAVGPEMGAALTELHRRHDVSVRTGVAVHSVERDHSGGLRSVVLSDGSVLEADTVVVGIGSTPATGWLETSGLVLHPDDRGIVCDENLRSSAPRVWAAGDVAHWHNAIFDRVMRLENWTSAAQQGAHIARAAVTGRPAAFSTVPYYWSDWYSHRIQFVGVPDADEILTYGSVDDGRMTALYRRGDRIGGALTLDRPRHIMKLRALIARGALWSQAVDLVTGMALAPAR